MNKKLLSLLMSGSILAQGIWMPVLANEQEFLGEEMLETTSSKPIYRLYNANSGEHFFTGDPEERQYLAYHGWKDEGAKWVAPASSNIPIYRLYNPNTGDHHYTTDTHEVNSLANLGWRNEGIKFYSASVSGVPIYRLYNPRAKILGSHHYTGDRNETSMLITVGWDYEGIGWYATGEDVPKDIIDPINTPNGNVEPTPTVTPSTPEQVNYSELYRPILDEAKKIAIEKGGNGNYRVDLTGVGEIAGYRDSTLDNVGYTIQDLSGDGIPELILGVMFGSSKYIVAVFTLVNNTPVNAFYGWARSCYYYAGGSSFIFSGSSGASYVTTGLLSLSKDGTTVTYSEYYYTNPDTPLSPIKTYSSSGPNSTGKYIGGENVYSQKYKQIMAKQQDLNLTPFSQWK